MSEKNDNYDELTLFEKIFFKIGLIICILGFAFWVLGIFQVGLNPTG